MRKIILRFSAACMLLLGLISLFLSVSFMFNLFWFSKPDDHYVLFVLFASFICSLIYLFAAYGFFREDKRTTVLLFIAASILIITFIGLLIHIQLVSLYEVITIRSLAIRTFITLLFTIISWSYLIKKEMVVSKKDLFAS
ncbi:MAG: hypothetical protein ABIR50_08485 [Ginsengibacter sp.]